MLRWFLLLGGLIVWTVHFFALYSVGSIFLTTDLARVLTLVITLLCLVANVGVAAVALRLLSADGPDRWVRAVSLWSVALGSVAVLWQGSVSVLL